MRRQTISVLTIVVGMFLIISLSKDLQRLLSSRERIEKEHESVKKLEEEQQALGKELEYALSDEFVEKEARDKLLMAKPGEVVVILPPYDEVTSSSDLVFDEDRKEELENWEKWVRLFF